MIKPLLLLTIVPMLAISSPVQANPLIETRYVTEIKRLANGDIMRRADVRAAFKKIHSCPSTGKSTGACPGWQMDHTVPLSVFGADSVSNLQWLPNELKTCAGSICKDRWERRVYAK